MTIRDREMAIKRELKNGLREKRCFGGTGKREIRLTAGRRAMLENQLRAIQKFAESHKVLWRSVEPEFVWDDEKKVHKFKGFRKVQGTYNRALHGELKPKR